MEDLYFIETAAPVVVYPHGIMGHVAKVFRLSNLERHVNDIDVTREFLTLLTIETYYRALTLTFQ